MGKLTPSKELRTVYKVLKRIHAAEQLEETDPGMFAPEVFDIDAAQRDRIMAMLQAEGLINGVIVRFDYQSVRHCSKTEPAHRCSRFWFDYQSVRHCSKTRWRRCRRTRCLITSQFDTAPKPNYRGS